jgi:hypothetical protein
MYDAGFFHQTSIVTHDAARKFQHCAKNGGHRHFATTVAGKYSRRISLD